MCRTPHESAFIAFAAGALMALFSVFEFVHLRRTAPEAEILPKRTTRVQAQAA